MIEFPAYFYQPVLTAVNQINMEITLNLEKMRERCGYQLYADATGSSGGVHTRHNLIGFKYNTYGALGGADYADCWGGFGLMVDYERINERPFHELERITIDHLHGSVYSTFFPTEALTFNAIVGGGCDSHSIHHFDAYLGTEYAINPCISPVIWTPLFALQYIHLTIPKRKIESFRTILGIKASSTLMIEGIEVTPEINWAWQREFLHRRQFFSSLDIRGPSHSIYLAGFDLSINLCNGLGIDLGYEFEGSHSLFNHFYYAGALVAF